MTIYFESLLALAAATITFLCSVDVILKLIISLVIAVAIHECAHCLAAMICGKRLQFQFKTTKLWFIPIPRLVWEMPEGVSVKQNNFIALSGFGVEVGIAIVLLVLYFLGYSISVSYMYYVVMALLHLCLYKFYAGDYNDFSMVIRSQAK